MAGFHRQRKRARRAQQHQEPSDAAPDTGNGTGDTATHHDMHPGNGGPDPGDPPADDGGQGGTAILRPPRIPDPSRDPGKPTPATVAAAHRGRDGGVTEPAPDREAAVTEPDPGRESGVPGADDAVPGPPQPAVDDVPAERPAGSASTAAVVDLEGETPAAEREPERGLRGLVGSGTSQVGVSSAIRARDAARPTPQDLAQAERDLVIVRRNWVPREPFRPGGSQRQRRDGSPPQR